MSPVIRSIESFSKKHYQLRLSDGQCLSLMIADMFSVNVTLDGEAITQVRFQPLSSLNNLEMQPVYRISYYQAASGGWQPLAQALLDTMVDVYAAYTQGSIKPWRAPRGQGSAMV